MIMIIIIIIIIITIMVTITITIIIITIIIIIVIIINIYIYAYIHIGICIYILRNLEMMQSRTKLKFWLFQKMWFRRPIQDLPMCRVGKKNLELPLEDLEVANWCHLTPGFVGFVGFAPESSQILGHKFTRFPVFLMCSAMRPWGSSASKPEAAKIDQRMSLFFYMLIGVGAGASITVDVDVLD